MNRVADMAGGPRADTVGLSEFLDEMSREIDRLAEQCGVIQWSISTMLDRVNHPDLGAEIHMLQDVDRIQQTLSDAAAILAVVGARTGGTQVAKSEIGAVIRLESLRQRLGLSDPLATDPQGDDIDVTWL